ncbi:hypothetical protein SAMN05421831_102245 [Allopseudospirillum japonicum]|uniref:UPF0125 protein SAMN05421831_102245 n=1 Tax=Allopseudospirillum japonicum TaxID=64971 RepID=A0A1H6QW02_9GAMM|nr:RnfH family protein [Allopseudospirillum japonicum]SEI47723.1 hypothetical protein SAMN05421831_102245 [Allopseudospirillum japonicum]
MADNQQTQASITIEVAYALAHKQKILRLQVPQGTKMREAAQLSGIQEHFPELILEQAPMGIFGKAILKPDQHILEEGDRVEIYRPLIADPKQARARRAAKAAKKSD